MAELKVKVPIRFSEQEQKDLYETCMAYKELAEMRGAENAKLRKLVRDMWHQSCTYDTTCEGCPYKDTPTCADCSICAREATVIDRMRELGIEVSDD